MRVDTTNIIADNPSTITITRKTFTVTNGVRSAPASETLAAQTVRLYYKNKTDRVREGDDFRFIRRRETRMLCEHDADVQEHSQTNEDTFSLDGKTYRVMDVRPVKWEGVAVSKQCTLEELS
jgi:hypothetical protein